MSLRNHPVATLAAAGAILGGGYAWGHGEAVNLTYGSPEAREHLVEMGMTSIKLKDVNTLLVNLRGCSEGDGAQYEFSAVDAAGRQVGVTLCKSLIKPRPTIELDTNPQP